MIDLEKLTKGERALVNATVVGGIAFFSTLATSGGNITTQDITTGLIAAGLSCLIRINDFLAGENEHDTDDKNVSSGNIKNKKKFKIGVIVS